MRKLVGTSAVLALLGSAAMATGLEIEVAGEANGTVKIDLLEDLSLIHI